MSTTTMLEITHLYCEATGLKVGEDGSTHHLVPRAAGPGAQIHRCKHCARSTLDIKDDVARKGLECGGRPGDDLHHVDGVHRASPRTANGRDVSAFERKRAAHFS